jgi:hypothetical protein
MRKAGARSGVCVYHCMYMYCCHLYEVAEERANAYVSLWRSSQLYVWFDGSTFGACVVAAEVHRRGGELVISEY